MAANTVNGAGVVASDNWWGSNTGPGALDLTTGATAATYLQLRVSASPTRSTRPEPHGHRRFTHDQGGTANTAHFVPDTTPVTFGGTAGTYPGGANQDTVNGQASATMTSGATPGLFAAGATATVDAATVQASVAVDGPPAITSADTTTFTVGTAGTFTVTTTGYPDPDPLRRRGMLPDRGHLRRQPRRHRHPRRHPGGGHRRHLQLTITATTACCPDATQTFTLTVDEAPAITSADSTTFTVGSAGTFTVTTTGFPTPTP